MTESVPTSRRAVFLRERLDGAKEYVRVLSTALDQCCGSDEAEEASVTAQVADKCLELLDQQKQAWHNCPGTGTKSQESTQQELLTQGSDKSAQPVNNKLARLAAMGGTPALGGMVLPKLSQEQLDGLSSTASPAAQELHAAKGHPTESPARSPPHVKTPESSPPWLVELRAKQGSRPPSRPSSPPRE